MLQDAIQNHAFLVYLEKCTRLKGKDAAAVVACIATQANGKRPLGHPGCYIPTQWEIEEEQYRIGHAIEMRPRGVRMGEIARTAGIPVSRIATFVHKDVIGLENLRLLKGALLNMGLI